MTSFAIKGTTGDITTCECCGRDDLKRTVILAPLDADGNANGDVTHYGSECAARAMGRRGEGAKVRSAAKKADELAAQLERNARRIALDVKRGLEAAATLEAIAAGTFTDADLRFGFKLSGMGAFVTYLEQTVRQGERAAA